MTPEELARLDDTLRGARLLLIAWQGVRRDMGWLNEHRGLADTIAEIEAARELVRRHIAPHNT